MFRSENSRAFLREHSEDLLSTDDLLKALLSTNVFDSETHGYIIRASG